MLKTIIIISIVLCVRFIIDHKVQSQPALSCSKLIIKALEQGVKYVHSRDLKVDRSQSNFYVTLKQLVLFYKCYDFFYRRHSLMNRPCYIIIHSNLCNTTTFET